jgi:hypothetical protein
MRLHILRNRNLALAQLLLGAALLLPSAGGAEGPSVELPAPADGGSCQADQGMSLEQNAAMARLAAQLREAESQSDDVVVLNGRGYRYDSDRVPSFARDLQQLQMELQRAKARQQP